MRAGTRRRFRWALIALALPFELAGQIVRERVEVDLVRVDLVVRDRAGKFLPDVSAAEVHLEIDGKACPIDGFTLLEPVQPDTLSHAPVTPEAEISIMPAAPDSGPSPAPRRPSLAMQFFVDETSSHQFDRAFVYRRLQEAFRGDLASDVRVALEAYDGSLRVVCPWTADARQFREALSNLAGRPVAARIGPPGILSPAAPVGASASNADLLEASFHIRSSRSSLIEALYRFPEDLATRKTLLFVTDGAPFLTSGDLARELIASASSAAAAVPEIGNARGEARSLQAERNARLLRDGQMSAYKAFSEWTDVAQLAIQRGVTLVPVRAAALPTGSFFSADFAGDGYSDISAGSARAIDVNALRSYGFTGQSMSQVAEWTGGEAIVSREALRQRVTRDLDERDQAYVLTFRDPHVGDRLFHSIRIRVDRPGARLEYRRGYRIPGEQEAVEDHVVMALYGQPADNPLGLRASAHVVKRERKAQLVDFVISYPAADALGAAEKTRDFWIVGVCANGEGHRTRVFHVRGQARLAAGEKGSSFLAPLRLRTDPDTRLVSLAVQDKETGIVSYLGISLAP
ncbi:MAG TPA: VWA domain-containing protein [Thermoanaerobaculia bacterium]